MSSIFYNGDLIDENSQLAGISSPGLLYGEGVFETALLKNGTIFLEDYHWERLTKGAEKLNIQLPDIFNREFFRYAMQMVAAHNNLSTATCRFTLIKNADGNGDMFSVAKPYSIPGHLNKSPFTLEVFRDAIKPADEYSALKHNNFLPYRMAKIFADREGANEAILLNQYGRVCEAGYYNIYIINGDTISTPPLSEGCIEGCFRKYLIRNFGITEKPLSIDEVLVADEVFLTNSVRFVQPVTSFKGHTYSTEKTIELFQAFKAENRWLFN